MDPTTLWALPATDAGMRRRLVEHVQARVSMPELRPLPGFRHPSGRATGFEMGVRDVTSAAEYHLVVLNGEEVTRQDFTDRAAALAAYREAVDRNVTRAFLDYRLPGFRYWRTLRRFG